MKFYFFTFPWLPPKTPSKCCLYLGNLMPMKWWGFWRLEMKREERLYDQPSSAKEGTTQEPCWPLSPPAPFSPAGGHLKLHQGYKVYEMAAVTITGLRGFGTNSLIISDVCE